MSRSTQFIGLNKRGIDFVSNMEVVQDKQNQTLGMFDEVIPLGVWRKDEKLYYEKVQIEPWSSGPMIFTCIVEHNIETGFLVIEETMWIEEYVERNEYNFDTGTYYV